MKKILIVLKYFINKMPFYFNQKLYIKKILLNYLYFEFSYLLLSEQIFYLIFLT